MARNRSVWCVDYSVVCRLRQLVDVQGYESYAEAAEEDDQVLCGDRHRDSNVGS